MEMASMTYLAFFAFAPTATLSPIVGLMVFLLLLLSFPLVSPEHTAVCAALSVA